MAGSAAESGDTAPGAAEKMAGGNGVLKYFPTTPNLLYGVLKPK